MRRHVPWLLTHSNNMSLTNLSVLFEFSAGNETDGSGGHASQPLDHACHQGFVWCSLRFSIGMAFVDVRF